MTDVPRCRYCGSAEPDLVPANVGEWKCRDARACDERTLLPSADPDARLCPYCGDRHSGRCRTP